MMILLVNFHYFFKKNRPQYTTVLNICPGVGRKKIKKKIKKKADRMLNISIIRDYIEEFDSSYYSHIY